ACVQAWRMWSEDKAAEFMDASLAGSYAKEEAWRCYHAGLLCVQESPELRPTMSSVVLMLIGDQAQLPAPEQPPLFASPKKAPASDQSSLAVRSDTTSKTHSVNDVSITMIQPR
uniref:S-locus receptor kinase C-terminal domain-containing protein n=1 Tax=Aegilops tauschii subsp. strangulata TaxID=200361 RepID=A0A453PDJ2_AEGTS